ncbi:GntR family transcriptional regulator [Roseomonas sp. USHLN139]|uniref:GntR family transcriptional regulator n=1 Tax=Roseomonas sp. USHLN139 TaxID=3081298 RepID=UPI003B01D22C
MSTIQAAREAAQSLSSKVQAALEALIWSGALPPGARLNEVTLARQLGVSRGPVREAARALERTGLVTVILNRGAFVRTLTIDEAMQIYELNSVLFGSAAARLAVSCTGEQAMALRAIVDRMDQRIAGGDPEGFFAGNVEFHEHVMAFSGNAAMEAVYVDHTRKLSMLRRRSFDRAGSMAEANAEHRRLLESILAGDAASARQLAEQHTRSGRARFLTAIAYQEAQPRAATAAEKTRINA